MKFDTFLTPDFLALSMVEAVKAQKPEIIVDFAVGDGALLKVAANQWPNSRIIGLDINSKHISTLRKFHSTWEVERCDFLKAKSRNTCGIFRKLEQNVSLALLNPPFSYRGGMFYECSTSLGIVKCSKAFAFVLTAIKYLRADGEIVALLPAGCMTTEKDRSAREALNLLGDYQIVSQHQFKTFPEVHAKTVVVHFKKSLHNPKRKQCLHNIKELRPSYPSHRIFRGTIQMHTLNGNTPGELVPLIHTTEMKSNGLNVKRRKVNTGKSCIKGPAVLLPRVGNPKKEKVLLWPSRKRIALSDCVLAIQCNSHGEAKEIRRVLHTNWNFIRKLYGGTCAPYITINALEHALLKLRVFTNY